MPRNHSPFHSPDSLDYTHMRVSWNGRVSFTKETKPVFTMHPLVKRQSETLRARKNYR